MQSRRNLLLNHGYGSTWENYSFQHNAQSHGWLRNFIQHQTFQTQTISRMSPRQSHGPHRSAVCLRWWTTKGSRSWWSAVKQLVAVMRNQSDISWQGNDKFRPTKLFFRTYWNRRLKDSGFGFCAAFVNSLGFQFHVTNCLKAKPSHWDQAIALSLRPATLAGIRMMIPLSCKNQTDEYASNQDEVRQFVQEGHVCDALHCQILTSGKHDSLCLARGMRKLLESSVQSLKIWFRQEPGGQR